MSERRRVLMVTSALPYPPNWGAGMRNFQLLRHLARRDDVTLLSFVGPDADPAHLAALSEVVGDVRTVPVPAAATTRKRQAQVAAMLLPLSYQYLRLRSAAFQRAVHGLQREQPHDLVQVESSQMAHFDFGPAARLVVDEHNIEFELLDRMASAERAPLRKLYNRVEHVKFRRTEVATWRRAAGCVFTSEREREIAARGAPATPTTVVPNGVDTAHFVPAPWNGREEVVFAGIQSYRPNQDAALWFIRSILPLVLRERPAAVFRVVGQEPPPDVRRLRGRHVDVTGRVEDVRPHLARAAVAVAPLRMGGGTRLKVLEALAAGRAVVSTSVGCEGLAVRSGQHLLIADTEEEFARHVTRLLGDPAYARGLGREGRRLVEREYSWDAAAARLRAFHTEIVARTRELHQEAS